MQVNMSCSAVAQIRPQRQSVSPAAVLRFRRRVPRIPVGTLPFMPHRRSNRAAELLMQQLLLEQMGRQRQQQGSTMPSNGKLPFPVDTAEDDDNYYLFADLPGVAKGELKITTKDQTVTIMATRRRPGAPEHSMDVHAEPYHEPAEGNIEEQEDIDTQWEEEEQDVETVTPQANDQPANTDAAGVKPDNGSKLAAASEKSNGSAASKQGASSSELRPRRRERWFGDFVRQLTFPDDADVHRTSAKLVDGVLTITIAKKEESKPKYREVQIS